MMLLLLIGPVLLSVNSPLLSLDRRSDLTKLMMRSEQLSESSINAKPTENKQSGKAQNPGINSGEIEDG